MSMSKISLDELDEVFVVLGADGEGNVMLLADEEITNEDLIELFQGAIELVESSGENTNSKDSGYLN